MCSKDNLKVLPKVGSIVKYRDYDDNDWTKKTRGISMSLGFWPWNSHNFAEFLESCKILVFSGISKGKVTDLKMLGFF